MRIRKLVDTVHLSQEEKLTTTNWTRINDDVNLIAMITMFGYKLLRYELHPSPPRATAIQPQRNAFAMLMEGGKNAAAAEESNLPPLNCSDDGTEPTGEKLLDNHVITSLKDHGIKFKSKITASEVVRLLTGHVYILLDASVDTIAARDVNIKRVLGSLGIGYVKEKSVWVRRSTYDDAATSHKVKEQYCRRKNSKSLFYLHYVLFLISIYRLHMCLRHMAIYDDDDLQICMTVLSLVFLTLSCCDVQGTRRLSWTSDAHVKNGSGRIMSVSLSAVLSSIKQVRIC
jgi:hypothetical protein